MNLAKLLDGIIRLLGGSSGEARSVQRYPTRPHRTIRGGFLTLGLYGFVPASGFGLPNAVTGQRSNGFVIAEEHLQIAPLDESASSLIGDVVWH
jgi:hypothetical protein